MREQRDMRLINVFLSGLLIVAFGFPSFAIDEEFIKERNAEQLTQQPYLDIADLWPEVQRHYQRRIESVVYIVTEEGIEGSGTVISKSFGLIITNSHVVGSESFVSIVFDSPSFQNNFQFKKEDIYSARVLKSDPVRDLALLEVISPPSKMTAVPLGSISRLEVGQDIFSVSHSQSLLWNYTGGVITQIQEENEWTSDIGTFHRATTIQIQTLSGQGSSGDPLFDVNGHFIGLIAGSSSAIQKYAIATDEIREFAISVIRPTIPFQEVIHFRPNPLSTDRFLQL
ncbi:MAG: serine protease [Candidatus Binatia bacterium]